MLNIPSNEKAKYFAALLSSLLEFLLGLSGNVTNYILFHMD